MKLKPELANQEVQSLFTNFTDTVESCCKAKAPEACFNQEVVQFSYYNSSDIPGEKKLVRVDGKTLLPLCNGHSCSMVIGRQLPGTGSGHPG